MAEFGAKTREERAKKIRLRGARENLGRDALIDLLVELVPKAMVEPMTTAIRGTLRARCKEDK